MMEKHYSPSRLMSTILPTYWLGKVFALSPFKLTKNVNGRTIFKSSEKIPFLAILHMLILASVIWVCDIYMVQNAMHHTGSALYKSTKSFTYIASCIFSTLSMLIIIIKRKYVPQTTDELLETERILNNMGAEVDYRPVKWMVFIQVTMVIMSFVCGTVFRMSNGWSYLILYHIGIHLPSELTRVVIVQFTQYVLLIRRQFVSLNGLMANWAIDNDLPSSQTFIKAIKVKSFLSPQSPMNEFEDEDSKSLANLRAMKRLHYKLCDIARTINLAYDWQILTSITQMFLHLIFEIQAIYRTPSIENAYWMAVNCFHLASVPIICTLCQDEAENTSKLLHKNKGISNKQHFTDTMQSFSLQMLHQYVQFTAHGLFDLDNTLLYSIIAGITSISVILIQFSDNENMSPTLDPTNTTDLSTSPLLTTVT